MCLWFATQRDGRNQHGPEILRALKVELHYLGSGEVISHTGEGRCLEVLDITRALQSTSTEHTEYSVYAFESRREERHFDNQCVQHEQEIWYCLYYVCTPYYVLHTHKQIRTSVRSIHMPENQGCHWVGFLWLATCGPCVAWTDFLGC